MSEFHSKQLKNTFFLSLSRKGISSLTLGSVLMTFCTKVPPQLAAIFRVCTVQYIQVLLEHMAVPPKPSVSYPEVGFLVLLCSCISPEVL
jgi:hypothetical protein